MSPRTNANDDIDDLFALFGSSRRRTILCCLRNHAGPMGVGDLVDAVVECERRFEADPTTDEVSVSLHHVHLPKLRAAGVVSEPSEGTIAYRATASVETLFEWLATMNRSDSAPC